MGFTIPFAIATLFAGRLTDTLNRRYVCVLGGGRGGIRSKRGVFRSMQAMQPVVRVVEVSPGGYAKHPLRCRKRFMGFINGLVQWWLALVHIIARADGDKYRHQSAMSC